MAFVMCSFPGGGEEDESARWNFVRQGIWAVGMMVDANGLSPTYKRKEKTKNFFRVIGSACMHSQSLPLHARIKMPDRGNPRRQLETKTNQSFGLRHLVALEEAIN